MAKLTFWDKTSDLQFPAGYYTAAEYMKKEPWTRHGQVVLESSRGVALGLHNFAVLCENLEVPEDLEDEEALAFIAEKIAEQKQAVLEASLQPSTEERIAAAMEFQNLMSL